MKKIGSMLFIAFSVLMLQSCNNAGNTSKSNPLLDKEANKGVQNADVDFMTEAAIGGMLEVKLGKIAQEKASNPRVKNFGEMMVNDHSTLNGDLKSIAGNFDVNLPDTIDMDDQNKIDSLKSLSGEAFDQAYMKTMVKDHNTDIGAFKKERGTVENDTLKNFINMALPVLEKHLDSAQAIHGSIK